MVDEFSVAGTVVSGRIQLTDPDGYRMYVSELPDGLCVEVTVSAEKATRPKTHDQVKYWWAVPVPLCADHCGTSDKQMHRDLMAECFGYETNAFGKLVPVRPSMSDLTVEEMTHLIEWVLDWAPAELEVIVPPPDKNWRKHADTIRRQRRRAA